MLPYIYTKHACERKKRFDFIERFVGFGYSIKEIIDEERGVVQRLTNTGVVLILDLSRQRLITAYLLSFDRAEYFYNGFSRIPKEMKEIIELNEVYMTFPDYQS